MQRFITLIIRATSTARSALWTGTLILAVLLSGCAGRPDVMTPSGLSVPRERQVDMLVATTREASADRALLFTGERAEDIRLARVVVSLPPPGRREPGTILWPSPGGKDPDKTFLVQQAEEMSEAGARLWFKRTSGPSRRALIFVHGFNTSFAEATFRFAQMTHDLGAPAAPILFTWPSRGSALDYVYDRESATYSRSGLVEVLDQAVASDNVAEITLVAHSMGAWLAMEALRQLGIRDGTVSPKVRTVVLASPDIDVDVFKRQVLEMGKARPRFLLVASRNDTALSLSRWIAGDVDRLGGADLRTHLDVLASHGITLVDATDEPQLDALSHNAFADSTGVLRSVARFISSGGRR